MNGKPTSEPPILSKVIEINTHYLHVVVGSPSMFQLFPHHNLATDASDLLMPEKNEIRFWLLINFPQIAAHFVRNEVRAEKKKKNEVNVQRTLSQREKLNTRCDSLVNLWYGVYVIW